MTLSVDVSDGDKSDTQVENQLLSATVGTQLTAARDSLDKITALKILLAIKIWPFSFWWKEYKIETLIVLFCLSHYPNKLSWTRNFVQSQKKKFFATFLPTKDPIFRFLEITTLVVVPYVTIMFLNIEIVSLFLHILGLWDNRGYNCIFWNCVSLIPGKGGVKDVASPSTSY